MDNLLSDSKSKYLKYIYMYIVLKFGNAQGDEAPLFFRNI